MYVLGLHECYNFQQVLAFFTDKNARLFRLSASLNN